MCVALALNDSANWKRTETESALNKCLMVLDLYLDDIEKRKVVWVVEKQAQWLFNDEFSNGMESGWWIEFHQVNPWI